jgi:hypothetical protein
VCHDVDDETRFFLPLDVDESLKGRRVFRVVQVYNQSPLPDNDSGVLWKVLKRR